MTASASAQNDGSEATVRIPAPESDPTPVLEQALALPRAGRFEEAAPWLGPLRELLPDLDRITVD